MNKVSVGEPADGTTPYQGDNLRLIVWLKVARIWCAHSSRFTGDTVVASDPGHRKLSQPRTLRSKAKGAGAPCTSRASRSGAGQGLLYSAML